jgi:outer membrane protein assembly factor BamB
LKWSETENLKWKTPLPGPGSSSPIIYKDRVFVTCYSGYGLEDSSSGNPENLKRHLLCINRKDGTIIWDKSVKASLPEDTYRGNLREHGYASSTPVTDGERVYVFFGKTGVLAFDLKGEKLWQVGVGTESSNRRWGSASSPILYKDLLIVNASEENLTIYALDKNNGREVWKVDSDKLELTYGTPVMVDLKSGRKELVVAVPYEVWGFEPETGVNNWYSKISFGGNISPSPIAEDGVVYVTGGFPRIGSAAIRAGGKDDVTETHVVWSSNDGSYVPSPIFHDGYLYWVSDRGEATCLDAKTGKRIYREKLAVRGGSKPVYASVVLVDDKLYAVSRWSGTVVLGVGPRFEQIAHNQLPSDESDFNGSPAISDGQMFLRSNRFLYCISK